VNEIQSSTLLKDEALLVLQAAFKGFLLRNLSHSRHLKKLSKMDVDDKTIFGDTALPFLKAGFKGYLTQTREITSPPEM
jgi:spore coat protein CotF